MKSEKKPERPVHKDYLSQLRDNGVLGDPSKSILNEQKSYLTNPKLLKQGQKTKNAIFNAVKNLDYNLQNKEEQLKQMDRNNIPATIELDSQYIDVIQAKLALLENENENSLSS